MLASITLMTVDHRQHHLEAVRAALSAALFPLQYLVNLPTEAGGWLAEGFNTRMGLLRENAALREQQLLLRARLQKFAALQAENARLRKLLESSSKVGERVLIAELLAVDLDPNKHQVLINKGGRQGVYVGQPVLDAAGVMGQILHTGPVSSTAILITDPNHALPVQVNRNGLRAIAVGTGSLNRLELPHLPNNVDIRVGDLLITSGLGGRFPPDYPVAVVSEVLQDPGSPFAAVAATPTARLDRSREVLLVWSARKSVAPAAPASRAHPAADAQTATEEAPAEEAPAKAPSPDPSDERQPDAAGVARSNATRPSAP